MRVSSSCLLLSVSEEDSSSVSATKIAVVAAGVLDCTLLPVADLSRSTVCDLDASSLGAKK